MTEKTTTKRAKPVLIQIAVSSGTPGTEDRRALPDILYALASDGSVWWIDGSSRKEWRRMPDFLKKKSP